MCAQYVLPPFTAGFCVLRSKAATVCMKSRVFACARLTKCHGMNRENAARLGCPRNMGWHSSMSMQIVTKLRNSLALLSNSLVLMVAMCVPESLAVDAVPLLSATERRRVFDDAIATAPAEQAEGLRFLVSNMPDEDLQRISIKL